MKQTRTVLSRYNLKFQMGYFLATGILFTAIFWGCVKDVPLSDVASDTYIHTYPEAGNQSSWYVKPTEDRGCLFIGVEDEIGYMIVLRTDEKGWLVSKDTLKGIDVLAPVFTNLSDGSILIVSGYNNSNLVKLDKHGKLVFKSNFGGTNYWNSYPVLMKDGNYAITSAAGPGPGTSSRISFVKPDGTKSGQFQINDATFGTNFKTIYTSLHRCDTIGTYYFNGYCWPNWNGSFRSRWKLFIAKQKYVGNALVSSKTVVIDSANKNSNISGLYQVNTSDDHTLLATSFADINNIQKGRIFKLDADLNIVWESDIKLGYTTYVNGISECPDGNYLITGGCYGAEKPITQSMACKMDKNGRLLWYKIYPTRLSHQIAWGEQAADGSCYFGGHANSFGKAMNLMDLFLMKTDAEGNLK